MLEQKDLEMIGEVVRVIIREEVPPMVRNIVNEELTSLMEHNIMPQFERIYRELATKDDVAKIGQQMVTRGYVEDRMDKHLVDHHLKLQTA